jgi:hypothetical protein
MASPAVENSLRPVLPRRYLWSLTNISSVVFGGGKLLNTLSSLLGSTRVLQLGVGRPGIMMEAK